MKFQRSVKVLALALVLMLVIAGCSQKDNSKEITLAYVAWDSEIASTNVIKHVLKDKLGYKVTMLQVDAGPMWSGVSDGSADAMVAAWLPMTHESYYETNEGKFVDLGPNLYGTKIGLVVPTYWEDINSIEDLKDGAVAAEVNATITGIEPGAGIMTAAENAIEEYELEDWTLLVSSSAGMAAELQAAYEAEQPIIVTGWTPHWKFGKMDLKYLDDPKGAFGGEENIHTIVRKDLDNDMPDAYKLLEQFEWTADDMAEVMVDILDGMEPEEAAAKWVEANPDLVDTWLNGVE